MSASTREFHPGERTVARQREIAAIDLYESLRQLDRLASELGSLSNKIIEIESEINRLHDAIRGAAPWLIASAEDIAGDLQRAGYTVPDAPDTTKAE